MKIKDLIKLLIPDGVLQYFEIIDIEDSEESVILHLEERNTPPKEYKSKKLTSKGFYEPITVQDFPLRGRPTHLKIRRRRWLVEESGEIVSRDWDLVAKGTRMTQEFASFLKEIS